MAEIIAWSTPGESILTFTLIPSLSWRYGIPLNDIVGVGKGDTLAIATKWLFINVVFPFESVRVILNVKLPPTPLLFMFKLPCMTTLPAELISLTLFI